MDDFNVGSQLATDLNAELITPKTKGPSARSAATPGTNEPMFIVGEISIDVDGGELVDPLGTGFAIGRRHFLTACHNVRGAATKEEKAYFVKEIVLLKELAEKVHVDDINLRATYVDGSTRADEDWAIFERTDDKDFDSYVEICTEANLPKTNEMIGVRDYPVGYWKARMTANITIESSSTKVSNYDRYVTDAKNKDNTPRVAKVVYKRPPSAPLHADRVMNVRGGRVKGSCGAAYFTKDNTVAAFHITSFDEDLKTAVFAGTRTFTANSQGLILCRIPSFMKVYNKLDSLPSKVPTSGTSNPPAKKAKNTKSATSSGAATTTATSSGAATTSATSSGAAATSAVPPYQTRSASGIRKRKYEESGV